MFEKEGMRTGIQKWIVWMTCRLIVDTALDRDFGLVLCIWILRLIIVRMRYFPSLPLGLLDLLITFGSG